MLTSAKVSLRCTFADVNGFKLSYGPQLRLISQTFCRYFMTTSPYSASIEWAIK